MQCKIFGRYIVEVVNWGFAVEACVISVETY